MSGKISGTEKLTEFYLEQIEQHKDGKLRRGEFPLSTGIGDYKAWAEVANRDDLGFTILYNVVIPEDQRYPMAEYLMRVNNREYPDYSHSRYGTAFPSGYFDMNFDTGEVFIKVKRSLVVSEDFESQEPVEHWPLEEWQILDVTNDAFFLFQQFFGGISKILSKEMRPKQAFEEFHFNSEKYILASAHAKAMTKVEQEKSSESGSRSSA